MQSLTDLACRHDVGGVTFIFLAAYCTYESRITHYFPPSGTRLEPIFHILFPLDQDLGAIVPEISFASTTQDCFNPPAEPFHMPWLGWDNFNPQQLRNLLQGQSGHGQLLYAEFITGV